jgi:anti-sigma regulatory factor (Ser/Thr protein kinase)
VREDLTMSTTVAQPCLFTHAALLYEGEQDFVDQALGFIREGLAAEEPVLVVVDARKIELLREGLNGEADRVLFADMGEIGGNPARIIPAWDDFVAEHQLDGRPVRGIGEPLDGEVIEEALRNHPYVIRGDARRPSPKYPCLSTIAEPFDAPLPPPPPAAEELLVDRGSLLTARHLIADRAAEADLGSERASDLVLAVNEVLTNSVRHGGGEGRLRIWQDGGALVCEVADSGRIHDPLVDRRRPLPDQLGGRGLWMANQLCDLMQVRSFPAGNTIRLRMRRG